MSLQNNQHRSISTQARETKFNPITPKNLTMQTQQEQLLINANKINSLIHQTEFTLAELRNLSENETSRFLHVYDWNKGQFHDPLKCLSTAIHNDDLYWESVKASSIIPFRSSFPTNYPSIITTNFNEFREIWNIFPEAMKKLGVSATYLNIGTLVRTAWITLNPDLFRRRSLNKEWMTVEAFLNTTAYHQRVQFIGWLDAIGFINRPKGEFPDWMVKLGCIDGGSRKIKTIYNSQLTTKGIALFKHALAFFNEFDFDLYFLKLLKFD